MSSKINLFSIVRAHFNTLRDVQTQRRSVADWLTFYAAPLVGAGLLMRLHLRIDKDYVNIIVSMLSIFVGLLLNMIVVLFDIIRSERKRVHKVAVLEEVLANISFTIVLSIFTIGVVLLTQLNFGRPAWQPYIEGSREVINFISFACLILFLLTLLMVVKRMYLLFMDEVNTAKKELLIQQQKSEAAQAALQANPLA